MTRKRRPLTSFRFLISGLNLLPWECPAVRSSWTFFRVSSLLVDCSDSRVNCLLVGLFLNHGLPFPCPPSAPHTSSLIKQFCVYLGINLWHWMETKPLVINEVFAPARPGSAGVQPPEASSQHSAQGRPGIMCLDVKLRAELLFSAKTIISTFPTIILIPSPITAVLPPSLAFHLIILPLITFADFVAPAAHLCCKTILSSGCFREGRGVVDGNCSALTFNMFTLSWAD